MIYKVRLLKKILKIVWLEFYAGGCLTRAASLAYTTLLCLVPLATVSFYVFTAFPTFKDLGAQIQDFIFSNFVAEAAKVVGQYMQTFINQAGKLSVFGMVFLLGTAVLLVFSMEQIFNAIWHVKRNRHGVTAFLLYWAVITLIPIAIGMVFVLNEYFWRLPFLASSNLAHFRQIMALCVPYIATFIAFLLLYQALPNCKVPVKSAMLGALVATILFELSRRAFALYILNFATYQLIYGALAAMPVFLVWLYISWVVVLFGAVVNYVLADQFQKCA